MTPAYDLFQDCPDFPFNQYYKRFSDYTSAQSYWLYLIRQQTAYVESDWGGVIRVVDMKRDLTEGLMYWLRNTKEKKEIILHTKSYEGCVNQHIKDNESFYKLNPRCTNNTDYLSIYKQAVKQAQKDVDTYYQSFLAYVEKAESFINDLNHADGGYIVPIDRLIIASEINQKLEITVSKVLESFLQKDADMDHINDMFSPCDW